MNNQLLLRYSQECPSSFLPAPFFDSLLLSSFFVHLSLFLSFYFILWLVRRSFPLRSFLTNRKRKREREMIDWLIYRQTDRQMDGRMMMMISWSMAWPDEVWNLVDGLAFAGDSAAARSDGNKEDDGVLCGLCDHWQPGDHRCCQRFCSRLCDEQTQGKEQGSRKLSAKTAGRGRICILLKRGQQTQAFYKDD